MYIKYRSLFFIFLLAVSTVFSQSAQKKVDSLMQVAVSSNDSIRLRLYNQISFYYIFNDSDKAKKLLLKGIEQAESKKIYFSEAELINTYGIYFDVSGNSDSAKFYFQKALDISEAHNYKIITVMVINNLGMFHWNKGNYQEALDYFFQALKMNKKNTRDSGNGTYFNNIGLIYQEMGQYDKALEYHEKSLAVRQKYDQKSEIATSLSNIAVVLGAQGKYAQSEEIFLKAIKMAKVENELGKYYGALSGLSDSYLDQNRPQKAIPLLKELLEGRNDNNIDRRSNLIAISHLIKAYNTIDNLPEALKYVEKGNDFLEEFPDLTNSAVLFFQNASQTYFRTDNPEKGSEYLEKAISAKEEIFSTENATAIANLETKFKVAEQERDLAQTRAGLAESQLKVEQKNIFIYGLTALAIILGLLAYLIYNQHKLKTRQLQKESELKTALAKIETQNQLQEQRLRISRDLHDNIGSQLTFIISSIDTLKYSMTETGNAVSDRLTSISNFTSQTIYELRDTIWAMNKTDISVDDLNARISNFIEKARDSSDVNFHFNVCDDFLKEKHFTSVQGMNIYRIMQEAVNNALKYSEAAEISISFSKVFLSREEMPEAKNGTFSMVIEDNGKGFDLENTSFGNGIKNIKKRAKDLDGKVEVTSAIGQGTIVRLDF